MTRPALDRGFVTRYTLAQIGAYIGFVPLLTVLLPLKAAAVAPLDAATLASHAAIWGALAAGVSHFMAGVLSDGTRSRFGRRRPWIIAGALALVCSYGGVFLASSPLQLILAIVLFQIAFNIMFAPLMAVFADRAPDSDKGVISAFAGLAFPIANLFAALVIALILTEAGPRYWAVAATVLLLVAPFCLWAAGDQPAAPGAPPPRPAPWLALADRDFRLAFGSKLLVQSAIATNALYLLFYLRQEAAGAPAGLRSEAVLGLMIAASTIVALVSGFVAGVWSDRLGRRKIFVAFGGVAMAAGAALLAYAPVWPGPLVAQLIYGLGLGVFTTLDTALIAQVLPTRARVGRDLGLMNIAATLPQVLAPLVGVTLLNQAGWSLLNVFAGSAVLALSGGLLALLIRRTR